MKKISLLMVRHNLIDDQKSERVKISKEILNLLNDGRHDIISRIIISDVHTFFDVPTLQ